MFEFLEFRQPSVIHLSAVEIQGEIKREVGQSLQICIGRCARQAAIMICLLFPRVAYRVEGGAEFGTRLFSSSQLLRSRLWGFLEFHVAVHESEGDHICHAQPSPRGMGARAWCPYFLSR